MTKVTKFYIFWSVGVWCWLKLGPFLVNKGLQKMNLLENVDNKSSSANPIFFDDKKAEIFEWFLT